MSSRTRPAANLWSVGSLTLSASRRTRTGLDSFRPFPKLVNLPPNPRPPEPEAFVSAERHPPFHLRAAAFHSLDSESFKPEKEIRSEIQAIIRQITASVTFLPILERQCQFPVAPYCRRHLLSMRVAPYCVALLFLVCVCVAHPSCWVGGLDDSIALQASSRCSCTQTRTRRPRW